MSDNDINEGDIEDNNDVNNNEGDETSGSSATREDVPVPLVRLVKKQGKHTSTVWNFFGFDLGDELQKRVICMQCYACVKTTTGNTQNLLKHLQRHHILQYEQATRDKPKKKPGRQTSQASITQDCSELLLFKHLCPLKPCVTLSLSIMTVQATLQPSVTLSL